MFAIFVVFLAMKLGGSIAWSWWIVTLPLWFGVVATIIVFISICIIIMGVALIYIFCIGIYGMFTWLIELFSK